ncbi:hypothetical protein [Acinetobacter proteolyticus]|uniref:TonB-dependent receptor n=1 Tax=Acinetobacter proteolyticus TaxID=1776741 RepID=A0A2N0WAA6_9GAMM|nr:hypothetical protein [Acinetobacter proteolyticus]MBK5646071.1 hypothetical protein [Acinetobacter sp.]PKF31428.1 hypothetical protein CW311_19370 [Acinetobacter proteolyticus]
MTRYYLAICSLFACFPLLAQESIHRAVYQLPSQTEIVVNRQKEQTPSSELKVSIRISPERNGLKIQLFKASNSERLNRHALALAQQIKSEDLPAQETSVEQRDHNTKRLFSNYEQVYYFISMQDQAVIQRIRRVASPSSLTEMACLLLQKSVPLEGESFRLNVKLYIDKEGKIHHQETQPPLEKSLMNQLFPYQKRTQPFYKIFDLERQQYIDMPINQPIRFICTA